MKRLAEEHTCITHRTDNSVLMAGGKGGQGQGQGQGKEGGLSWERGWGICSSVNKNKVKNKIE